MLINFFKIIRISLLFLSFYLGSVISYAQCFLETSPKSVLLLNDLVEKSAVLAHEGITPHQNKVINDNSKDRYVPYYGFMAPKPLGLVGGKRVGHHMTMAPELKRQNFVVTGFLKGLEQGDYSIVVSEVRRLKRFIALICDLEFKPGLSQVQREKAMNSFKKIFPDPAHISILQITDEEPVLINISESGPAHNRRRFYSPQALIAGIEQKVLNNEVLSYCSQFPAPKEKLASILVNFLVEILGDIPLVHPPLQSKKKFVPSNLSDPLRVDPSRNSFATMGDREWALLNIRMSRYDAYKQDAPRAFFSPSHLRAIVKNGPAAGGDWTVRALRTALKPALTSLFDFYTEDQLREVAERFGDIPLLSFLGRDTIHRFMDEVRHKIRGLPIEMNLQPTC